MAQEPIENAKNEEEATPKPLKMQVLAQYIRDMSFENILAQKGISGEAQPDVSVQVNIDAKKRPVEHQFEVIIKTEISSKPKDKGGTMFLYRLILTQKNARLKTSLKSSSRQKFRPKLRIRANQCFCWNWNMRAFFTLKIYQKINYIPI